MHLIFKYVESDPKAQPNITFSAILYFVLVMEKDKYCTVGVKQQSIIMN